MFVFTNSFWPSLRVSRLNFFFCKYFITIFEFNISFYDTLFCTFCLFILIILNSCMFLLLTLFRVGLFWSPPPPQNLPHISCNNETWHSCTLPKEHPNIQNIYESCDTPLEFCWHQYFFHSKLANFAISRNTDIDRILIHNF